MMRKFFTVFARKAAAALLPISGMFGQLAWGLNTFLAGSRRDWPTRAGVLYDNAVVAACLNWYIRQMSYPRIRVEDDSAGDGEPIESPLVSLIEQGILYDGSALWAGTLLSYWTSGNAYWLKLRSPSGKLIGFAWLPHSRCRVYSDEERLFAGIEFETYKGTSERFDRQDLVVFQHGIHPEDQRLGMSPLIGALRDVVTENLASTLTVSLLDNNGVGASIISSKGDIVVSAQQYEHIEKAVRMLSTGDLAGRLLPVPFPVEVTNVEAKLKDMQFDKVRAQAAARICAAFGIDPMVVSLPSEHKTYSNYAEANEAAHEQGLLPILARFAEVLTRDVLPELHPGRRLRVGWDLSDVRALADDEDALFRRILDAWRAGVIKRSEARLRLGFEPEPGDDVHIFDVMFAAPPLKAEAARRITQAAATARRALGAGMEVQEVHNDDGKNGHPSSAHPTALEAGAATSDSN